MIETEGTAPDDVDAGMAVTAGFEEEMDAEDTTADELFVAAATVVDADEETDTEGTVAAELDAGMATTGVLDDETACTLEEEATDTAEVKVAELEVLTDTTGASGVPETEAHAKLILVCNAPVDLGALKSQVISTYGQHTLSVPTFAISPETKTEVEVTALPTFFPVLSTS